jgi:hypothetical protein
VETLDFINSFEMYPSITTAAKGLGNYIEELIPGVDVLSGGTEGFVNRYQKKFAEVVERCGMQPHHLTLQAVAD